MVHLIGVIGFSLHKSDPTFPGNEYSQKNEQDSHNNVHLFVTTCALICSDARRQTHKFATFFLASNCGATIRIYSGSARAPPYVDKFRHRETPHVDRDAVSPFYSYYLNIVGGYYTHIICVLTNIRGLYSG